LFSSGVILFDNAKLRRIVCAHNFFNSFLSNNAVSLTDIKETVVFLPFVQSGDLDEGMKDEGLFGRRDEEGRRSGCCNTATYLTGREKI
jgi:hypothetical protein